MLFVCAYRRSQFFFLVKFTISICFVYVFLSPYLLFYVFVVFLFGGVGGGGGVVGSQVGYYNAVWILRYSLTSELVLCHCNTSIAIYIWKEFVSFIKKNNLHVRFHKSCFNTYTNQIYCHINSHRTTATHWWKEQKLNNASKTWSKCNEQWWRG